MERKEQSLTDMRRQLHLKNQNSWRDDQVLGCNCMLGYIYTLFGWFFMVDDINFL